MSAFGRLVYADWSSRAAGRWRAEARREGAGWRIEGPAPVGPLPSFVDGLFENGPVLAGFDMPLGLPAAFGRKTRLADFRAALGAFGTGDWCRVYEPALVPGEIGPARPFFPARPGPRGSTLHSHLAAGHGVDTLDALRRRCERGTAGERSASPLFWTLGPAAVGKATIHGWQEAVVPALRRGASLWPFDGADLAALAQAGRPVLTETYPGAIYRWLGLPHRGWSKRRQADRAGFGPLLSAWAASRTLHLSLQTRDALALGFGPQHGGDDGFDALVGLFGLLAVATGERGTGLPAGDTDALRWEGWIIGRDA